MNAQDICTPATRMLFLGDATLGDGFRLIGFETWVDPTVEQLDRILQELIEQRCKAFVVLDSRRSRAPSPALQRIRAEGGRIVVTEVPPLNAAAGFSSLTDEHIRQLLGGEQEAAD